MKEKYKLSLAVGGLLQPETITISKMYLKNADWDTLGTDVIKGNLLRKTRTTSTARYFKEIKQRLNMAHPFEIELTAADDPATPFVLFALCCRYYGILGDFVQEVIQDKISLGQDYLGLDDYYLFIENKRPLHPELDTLSPTGSAKTRQVIFKMLKEVGMITAGKDYRIQRLAVPQYLIDQYKKVEDMAALEHLLQRK